MMSLRSFRRDHKRWLVRVVFAWGGLLIALNSGLATEGSQEELITEQEILQLLPEGSRIASIPVRYRPDRSVASTKRGFVYVDTDRDGKREIVVAYVTPPHEYLVNGEEQEGFFRRAHVAVLKSDEEGYKKVWDTGGWGAEFKARIQGPVGTGEELAFTTNYFNVVDINDDRMPDIVFTRASFLAEGDEFEAWSWDGHAYRQIAKAPGPVRLKDLEGDGCLEIIAGPAPP